jgi:DNA-binding transcriptional LysR family regulator
MKHFDPDLLQTLVTFSDVGTLALTAKIVGRTPSAVTTQMQRLEELAGVPLLKAIGRRRVLTNAGERLLGHARRILAANNEAWLSVSGTEAHGRVGLGIAQDFVEHDLPLILNQFTRTHPRVRTDLRIGRTLELSDDLKAKKIDVLLALRRSVEIDEVAVMRRPMRWLCAKGGLVGTSDDEMPLAVLDPPCIFRDTAINALEANNIPYRLAATSPGLSGVLAAIRAGMAVTVRTSQLVCADVVLAPRGLQLPGLPEAEFSIRVRKDANEAAQRLAAVLAKSLHFVE